MTDIATGQELSASLMAYVKHFKLPIQLSIQSPNAPDQLEAIASSILTFQQKMIYKFINLIYKFDFPESLFRQ
jgi:hypothetical protein